MEIKPVKKPISKNPYLWMVLGAVMLVVVLYVSWYFFTQSGVLDIITSQPIE